MSQFEKSIEWVNKLKVGWFVQSILTIGSIIGIFVVITQTIIGVYLEKFFSSELKENSSVIMIAILSVILTTFYAILDKIRQLEIQENFRYKLNSLYNVLKKNEERSLSNNYVNNLQEEILSETLRQIKKISSSTDENVLAVNDEFERVQYVRHLFNNSSAKEIVALTYDYNGYFMNFWGGLSYEKFVDANAVASRRAKITRFFIFDRENFLDPKNTEKRELFDDIFNSLKLKNIETYLIWEQNIPSGMKMPKRSFLMIDENITSEIKYNESAGYLAFGHRESINRLKKRYKQLKELPKGDQNEFRG